MPSATSICNRALAYLGEPAITDLDEQSRPARICRTFFDDTRDAVLVMDTWNFAMKRAALNLLDETPSFEFEYAFALPGDCLRVVDTDVANEVHVIEGGKLLCNESEVSISYIARVEEAGYFSPAFVDVLAVRLAADLANPITQDDALVQRMMQLFEVKLKHASRVNAMEGTPEVEDTDGNGFVEAR